MDWKEYKEQRVRGELEWILEELNRFMKEKGEYIIENLLGVIPDCINELDKVKYQLWFYKTKTDSWRHVITSLSQESLEKQIKDKKFREVLRIEESAPYLIIPENWEIQYGVKDELMQSLIKIHKEVQNYREGVVS